MAVTFLTNEDKTILDEQISELSKEIENSYPNRVNVRDFGAVGDGVADDRQAIVDAFAAARNNLPCEVYFPAGVYGISNGITIDMAYGTGGLAVRGAGRDVTTIKYLEEGYNPDVTGTATLWYAIRIWPVGMPSTKPTDEADYLHDISITGLTVYDPDPIAHAWNTCKGDPDGEETHGFDLQYINRASVTNCGIINVGDEGIDLGGCIDAHVIGNHIVGSPAAGSSGGAISVGDGCRGVVVSGNTINGSADDETLENDVTIAAGKKLSTKAILPDGTTYEKATVLSVDTVFPIGTILSKENYGIAVESLYVPVSNVVIADNTITNILGNAVNIGATNDGSSITNLVIANNVISDCTNGIGSAGAYPKENIKIADNVIENCSNEGIRIAHGVKGDSITGNILRNISGDLAINLVSSETSHFIANNVIDGVNGRAMFISGDVLIKDCVIKDTGLANSALVCTISCYSGKMIVSGCNIINNNCNGGIYNATIVEDTHIHNVNGGDALKGTLMERIVNCDFNGRIAVTQPKAIVSGIRITSDHIGDSAITIKGSGSTVTGCVIKIDNYSAVKENAGCDYNVITNNVTNKGFVKVGGHSIEANNISLAPI